ncbi:hypothetical protein NDU88_002593 [Pleurodeles waltl]|uniref:Reverse transcriptase domain-containing protein n=1 Tax=Pleurodeles waltl TaxID=8319 RepID=A0AAV7LCY1_PLEWA|nr:hypothetical protein NDU88_002593 [Pleurodeles waltl]
MSNHNPYSDPEESEEEEQPENESPDDQLDQVTKVLQEMRALASVMEASPSTSPASVEQEEASMEEEEQNHLPTWRRDGTLCDTKEDIKKAVTDFYGDLYSEKRSDEDQTEKFLSGILRKVSTLAKEVLNAPLTLEELHLAVKSFKSGKTPGSDSLTSEFYTSLWDLVGPDLLELYEEMEQEGVMPHTLREGMIALLYKHKGERCDLKNWRPISHLNVDYKILAKTMVNRLKGTMGEIVHPDQTCGVTGRRVRDAIQYIMDRNIHAALVCLDQEKAFDLVSYEFMERVLQGFGLGEWTQLVTNGVVVSSEACHRMVHNLLRDYTDKDKKEREKEEEL